MHLVRRKATLNSVFIIKAAILFIKVMLPDQKEFDARQGTAEEVECNGKTTGFGVQLDLYTGLIQFNIKLFTEC